ncbi:MAG: hypothetical protein WDA74_11445 [Spirochaetota bacterium]
MLKYILIIILFHVPLYAHSIIGEVSQTSHKIIITNNEYKNKDYTRNNKYIYPGDNILCAKGSCTKILLYDGTGIEIKGMASFTINSIRIKEQDLPASIKAQYGTFIISQNSSFLDTSLIFETPSAIIKTVNASIFILAGTEETGTMVYKNKAGIASSAPFIKKAVILKEGEESFIKNESPPSYPKKVPLLLRGSWLSKNQLSQKGEQIVKQNQDNSIIDWIFRNRN